MNYIQSIVLRDMNTSGLRGVLVHCLGLLPMERVFTGSSAFGIKLTVRRSI